MEKKTKKLQLRKETIAVLNGQRMSHIVGGNVHGCQMNGQFYLDGEVINNDGNECVCINGGWQCQPIGAETSRNGEICQDTVKSDKCQKTYEGNTCPLFSCVKYQ